MVWGCGISGCGVDHDRRRGRRRVFVPLRFIFLRFISFPSLSFRARVASSPVLGCRRSIHRPRPSFILFVLSLSPLLFSSRLSFHFTFCTLVSTLHSCAVNASSAGYRVRTYGVLLLFLFVSALLVLFPPLFSRFLSRFLSPSTRLPRFLSPIRARYRSRVRIAPCRGTRVIQRDTISFSPFVFVSFPVSRSFPLRVPIRRLASGVRLRLRFPFPFPVPRFAFNFGYYFGYFVPTSSLLRRWLVGVGDSSTSFSRPTQCVVRPSQRFARDTMFVADSPSASLSLSTTFPLPFPLVCVLLFSYSSPRFFVFVLGLRIPHLFHRIPYLRFVLCDRRWSRLPPFSLALSLICSVFRSPFVEIAELACRSVIVGSWRVERKRTRSRGWG